MCVAESFSDFDRDISSLQDAVALGVGEVVSEVCDGIGDTDDLRFERHSSNGFGGNELALGFGVAFNRFDHIVCQVKPVAVFFEDGEGSDTLRGVSKAVGESFIEDVFADVSKWSVSHVVGKSGGFYQVFIEIQCSSDGASDLRDLKDVGHASRVVVALGVYEDLALVF